MWNHRRAGGREIPRANRETERQMLGKNRGEKKGMRR
jgi:hypothetical protein